MEDNPDYSPENLGDDVSQLTLDDYSFDTVTTVCCSDAYMAKISK